MAADSKQTVATLFTAWPATAVALFIMVMCFVPDCKHYSERDRCHFFRFPKAEKEYKTWIKNIRRADKLPTKFSKVCSCHFKDELKANGPTIFVRNENKIFLFENPEKKKCKRVCASNENTQIQSNIKNMDTDVNGHIDASNSVFASSQNHLRDLQSDVVLLRSENYILRKETEELTAKIKKLENQPFTYNSLKEKDHLVSYHTGLPNHQIFQLILKVCTKGPITYYADWNVELLTQEDQLLLTLMKLKLNLGHSDLAVRFAVSTATVSNIVLTWIHLLHEIIFQQLMSEIPSQTKNKVCLPLCFNNFRNCRMVLDCTEMNTEIPKKIDHQKLFYSSYKHRNTMKALLGIAPNGVITYVSELFPSSTSDREVFKNSNVCNIFQPGDMVLADKGFLISDLLPPEVHVNVPPFLFSAQFTPDQIVKTTNIARARIDVERAIRRVKVFQITRLLPKSLFEFSTKVFQVCAALTNFELPLLRDVEHLYNYE